VKVKAVVYGRETLAVRGKRGSEKEVVKWDWNNAKWWTLAASSARGSLRSTGWRQANLRGGVDGAKAGLAVAFCGSCCVVVETTPFVASWTSSRVWSSLSMRFDLCCFMWSVEGSSNALFGQTTVRTRIARRYRERIVPFPPAFFAVCPGLSERPPENEKQHEVLDARHLVELRSDFQPLEWVYLSVD
jgi:hypothetical protein